MKKSPYSNTLFSYNSSPYPSPFSVLRHMQRARPCSRCPIFEAPLGLCCPTVSLLRGVEASCRILFSLEAGTDTIEMVCPKVRGGVVCLRRIPQPGESSEKNLCSQHHPLTFSSQAQ